MRRAYAISAAALAAGLITAGAIILVPGGPCPGCTFQRWGCTTLSDAGYQEVEFVVAKVPDGGLWLPDSFENSARLGVHDLSGQCRVLGTAGSFTGNAHSPRTHSCACVARDAGPCNRVPAGPPFSAGEKRNTLQPGTFVGPGCLPAPCVEVFGFPGRPGECVP